MVRKSTNMAGNLPPEKNNASSGSANEGLEALMKQALNQMHREPVSTSPTETFNVFDLANSQTEKSHENHSNNTAANTTTIPTSTCVSTASTSSTPVTKSGQMEE